MTQRTDREANRTLQFQRANLKLKDMYGVEIDRDEWEKLALLFKSGRVADAKKNHIGDLQGFVWLRGKPCYGVYSVAHGAVVAWYPVAPVVPAVPPNPTLPKPPEPPPHSSKAEVTKPTKLEEFKGPKAQIVRKIDVAPYTRPPPEAFVVPDEPVDPTHRPRRDLQKEIDQLRQENAVLRDRDSLSWMKGYITYQVMPLFKGGHIQMAKWALNAMVSLTKEEQRLPRAERDAAVKKHLQDKIYDYGNYASNQNMDGGGI